MASSTESMLAEEAPPLVGVAAAASTKVRVTSFRAILEEEERRILTPRPDAALGLAPLRRGARVCSLLPRRHLKQIRVGQPLGEDELDDELFSFTKPRYIERLDMDLRLVKECLRHYNSMHLGNEYEPASGQVIKYFHVRNGIYWIHGNFVACQKRSGCFSFLPAPRTLFFFELAYIDGFNGVVKCTPLDEPVTEAYSVLGFPLWWSTRRSGKFDSVCKTCYQRFDAPHIFTCGHNNVDKVCEMCYLGSDVLHPYPGGFAFGYHNP